MRYRLFLFSLCTAWLMVLSAPAEETTDHATASVQRDPAGLFDQARLAYDEGRYAEAAARYTDLLESGYGGVEVLFNLGNAHFRNGRMGPAVLSYRRAWYLAPRDEDIRTNLGFALDHTGARYPAATPTARVLRRATLAEWVSLATVGWWIAAILVALSATMPHSRRLAVRLLGIVAVILVLSLAGAWQWLQLRASAEMVVVADDQVARYAPLEGSDTHFKLPAGSIVTRTEDAGEWLRVRMENRDGWVPKSACERVLGGGD